MDNHQGDRDVKRNRRTTSQPNPGARRLFSYLDGELRSDERRSLEREIAGDPALQAEVRACRALFTALQDMAPHAPARDLKARIIASLQIRPSRLSRLRAWLAGGAEWSVANVFAEFHDGTLPASQAQALRSLVARDPEAAAVLAGWGRLHRELGQLPALAPADGFSERVMAQVHLHQNARSGIRVRNLLAGLWPRRQERLAAASGVAFGPTAAVVATGYMLFANNPLVTLSNLAGFLWSQGIAALPDALVGTLGTGAGILSDVVPAGLVGAGAAPVFAGGLVLLTTLTALSGWILYRNVATTTGLERRHVSV